MNSPKTSADKNVDKSKTKVFVALSGGVDSAVSAALLKKEGYDVTGIYMKNWSGDDYGIQADCPWEVDQADAEAVCKHLGIPFRSFNFEKQYREEVVEYFFSEFEKGRTPNPDVMCNKEIKFKLFLDKAIEEGADLIATGHYARKVTGISEEGDKEGKGNVKEINHLFTGNDDVKNQVYFLYNITQEQLSRTLFPVGEYPKSKVRELAKEFNLPNANKPDSQGICFIGEINVVEFLMARLPKKPGDIIDIDNGQKVGEHQGSYFYTIGQRKGLGIGGAGDPFYVCDKDTEKNIVYVCHSSRHPKLFKEEVLLENIHWIANVPKDYNNLQAVIRYQQKPQSGRLVIEDKVTTQIEDAKENIDAKVIKFIFNTPQRAVTSGQSLVIFDSEECLGGGVIK